MSNEPIKRKPGRPRKNPLPPQVEAVPVPAENVRNAPVPVHQFQAEAAALRKRIIAEGEDGLANADDYVRFDSAVDALAAGGFLSPAQIAALDHDHDGEAGGSLPKASLTEHQIKAFTQDADDVYEGHPYVMREDSFHRIWTFRQEVVKDHAHMSLSVKRGPIEKGRLVVMSAYRYTDIAELLREIDAETAR